MISANKIDEAYENALARKVKFKYAINMSTLKQLVMISTLRLDIILFAFVLSNSHSPNSK